MFSGHSSALVPDMQKIWTIIVATSMLSRHLTIGTARFRMHCTHVKKPQCLQGYEELKLQGGRFKCFLKELS